jgi:hypothetical protein
MKPQSVISVAGLQKLRFAFELAVADAIRNDPDVPHCPG